MMTSKCKGHSCPGAPTPTENHNMSQEESEIRLFTEVSGKQNFSVIPNISASEISVRVKYYFQSYDVIKKK